MIPIIEVMMHYAGVKMDDFDNALVNRSFGGPAYKVLGQPTHYTTEGGGTYSSRPDLTRSGHAVVGGRAAVVAAPVGVAVVGAHVIHTQFDEKVVQNAPEEERRGLWQMFSSGLTGTFGIGSGLNL